MKKKALVGGIELCIENILDIDWQLITITDVKNLAYDTLIALAELITPEERKEIIKRCKYTYSRTAWWTVCRNFNPAPAHPQSKALAWVWLTHYLKIAIKREQVAAGIEEEEAVTIEEVENILG